VAGLVVVDGAPRVALTGLAALGVRGLQVVSAVYTAVARSARHTGLARALPTHLTHRNHSHEQTQFTCHT
jgi:hypothetical protein